MPYVFDGYNVYHAATKLAEAWLSLMPMALCEMIAEDMRRLRETAVVVFDGDRPRGRAKRIGPEGYIRIYYSQRITADDYIMDMIQANTAPKRLVVVSSDREIRRAAKRRRAKPMPAQAYLLELVKRQNQPPPPPREPGQKRRGLAEGEVEDWMDFFGLDVDDDDRDEFQRMKF